MSVWFAAILACNMQSVGCMIAPIHVAAPPASYFQTEAECKSVVETALEKKSHDPVGRAFLYMPGAVMAGGCVERPQNWKFDARAYKRYAPNAPGVRKQDAST